MTFGEVLRATRARNPDKLALVCGDLRLSYAQLDMVTDLLAANLATAGVRRDDRVGLFTPNCPELIFAYMACFKLGALAVPLNHRYRQAEAEYALEHSGATTLIVHEDKLSDTVGLPFDRLGITRRYLVGTAPKSIHSADFAPFAPLLADHGAALPPADFDEHQLATIMYTSGTTAKPKGVTHSHGTMWNCMRVQCESMDYTAEDVQLVSTSACHCAATYGIILPNVFVGGTAVMLNAPTAQQVVETIVRERVTRCQMLPTSLLELVEYLEQHPADLSSVRSFLAGGDVVPLDTHKRFRAAVGLEVTELCGMTEAITYCTNPPFGDKKLGSIGKPVRETEVRIADARGCEVPVGETGEIQIRGPANMVGYWNDTLHTAATLRDGWLSSGDLGREDQDGYFWFIGRKKEIIIRGGSNISPLEVEEVIDEHPAVHLSGVVGAPDKRLGQVVVAYVSLRSEVPQRPTVADLKQFVRQRIAEYKVPERFFLLDELPLNSTKKIDRQALHARVETDMRQAEKC